MKISYNDDEVDVFHPAVDEALKKYMSTKGLDKKYEIEHHPNIQTVEGIPDFIIKLKNNGKWIFVIEVKRTPNDSKSPEFWIQGRKYVHNNPNWQSGSPPYFMVTNIETSCFLLNRSNTTEQTITQCLLPNGIKEVKTKFGTTQNDENTVQEFSNTIVPKIFELLGQITSQGNAPASAFAQNFNQIMKEFISTQDKLAKQIQKILSRNDSWLKKFGFNNKKEFKRKMEVWRNSHDPQNPKVSIEYFSREFSRDCVFRIFTSLYCKEYFSKENLYQNIIFPTQIKPDNLQIFFENIIKIDFSNIFDLQHINFVPNNMDKTTQEIILKLTQSLNNEMKAAINENAAPDYVLNRIVGEEFLFPRKSLNEEGKVMTDPRLANFITTMCFELTTEIPEIFDPGCGTCNFLSYSYDQIKTKNPRLSHNEILSHLHGCDIDILLGKLGIFGLIMKEPSQINTKTKLDIRLNDFFEITHNDFKKYNIVMMNPPFIRPDNKRTPLDKNSIESKIFRAIKSKSYMNAAPQPNLFFYFIEMATYLLKDNGIASFILPQSFLNNENGKFIKEFLLSNFEILYVVAIPSSFFFQNIDISPCVLVLRKNNNTKNTKIKFIRLKDSKFFDTNVINTMDGNTHNSNLLVKKEKDQKDIRADENWREYILPETKYIEILKNSNKFEKISEKFYAKRGEVGNEGSGSAWFFPWSTKTVAGYKKFGKDFEIQIKNIEKSLMKLGIKNSDQIKNCIFSKKDLEKQQVLGFESQNNIDNYPGFKKFKKKFEGNNNINLPDKWNTNGFVTNAQIIIPTNLRKNLFVNYNPFWNTQKVYFSTNFVMFSDCKLSVKGITKDTLLKFIAGYLNSSFVQIMMEKDANNRESTRKIQTQPIKKIPIPTKLLDDNVDLIKEIAKQFEELQFGLTGEEILGQLNPRYKLDLEVSKLLLKIEPELKKIYKSTEELVTLAEADLKDLVQIRKER